MPIRKLNDYLEVLGELSDWENEKIEERRKELSQKNKSNGRG